MITESSSNIIPLGHFGPDITWDEHQRVERERFNGHGNPVKQIRFTAFTDIRVTKALRYIVKGVVPVSGFVVVWGEPKCGKSFFVFDMVAHVAAGWPYRGRRVKQCPVVYFALEGQQGFVARVEAFRRAHDVKDIPFYLSADRVVLPTDGTAIVQAIRREFPDVVPGIVVLDTLNRSISGSENDPQDMGLYVRAADAIREAFDCTVIVIHHCGTGGDRPRGHTSLTGAADAQIAVKRDAEGNVVATIEFMKDGPEGDKIASSLDQMVVGVDEDGEDITTCVVSALDAGSLSTKTKVTGQAALALAILHETLAESDEKPPPDVQTRTKSRTCLEKDWRSNWYAKTASDDTTQTAKQKAFVRAVDKLIGAQVIAKWGDHVWIA